MITETRDSRLPGSLVCGDSLVSGRETLRESQWHTPNNMVQDEVTLVKSQEKREKVSRELKCHSFPKQ